MSEALHSSTGENPQAALRTLIDGIVAETLGELFADHPQPQACREALVERLSQALTRERNGSWTGRVQAERQAAPGRAVPDQAPAIWKRDKQRGQSPADFIKLHYGPYLRADGTGLTRPDIKRLDPTLYATIDYWLHRGNQFPEDCPLPKKSEAAELELVRATAEPGAAKEWTRLLSAQRRRKNMINSMPGS